MKSRCLGYDLCVVVFRINRDVEMVEVPFVRDLMLVRREGIHEDGIGAAAFANARIGDVHFVAVRVGIAATRVVAFFCAARDDERDACGLRGRVQRIEECLCRALEVHGISRAVAAPGRRLLLPKSLWNAYADDCDGMRNELMSGRFADATSAAPDVPGRCIEGRAFVCDGSVVASAGRARVDVEGTAAVRDASRVTAEDGTADV